MLENIIYKKKLLALIVKGNYRKKKGIRFFTPNESTQQFGYMKHKKNHIILPHLHKKRATRISYTTEVIILLKGSIRIDFFETGRQILSVFRQCTFDVPFRVLAMGQSIVNFPTGKSINKWLDLE